jgi:multimeric flavodoxin WrbA
MHMKVIAFNGSAKKDGNTAILLKKILRTMEAEAIHTELYQMAGKPIKGCLACGTCGELKNRKCVQNDDILNECLEKMLNADAIILGSPVYFAGPSGQLKCLIDRAGYVARANGDMLRRKVGAAVVAVRRAGAIHAFDSMNHFFLSAQMIVVGSNYWNIGIGRRPGDVERDEEGMETMTTLGLKMAWALKRLCPKQDLTK